MPRHIALIVAIATLALARPVFAAPTQGSLVRIASNSAVYYVADDGKRHAFPDEGTYFTWFEDFDTVQVISPVDLAALPLGKSVTRKPGVRMIKLQTDPKTYAVASGGTLRWVKDEPTAKALYGPKWSTFIQDVSDAFFIDYQVGEDVTSASDFNVDIVNASATIDIDLRVRAGGTGGGSGTTTSTAGTFTVTALAPATPRTTVLGAVNAELSSFLLVAPTDASVTVVGMKLRAYVDRGMNDPDFQLGSDADVTSIVTRASDIVPTVSLYDDSGARLAGPVQVTADGAVTFSSLQVPMGPGTTRKLYVRGDVNRTVDLGGGIARLSFDVGNAASDLTFSSDMSHVSVVGTLPNGGLAPRYPVSVYGTGKLDFVWTGVSGYAVAGHDATVGTMSVTALNDDFDIRTLSLPIRGPNTSITRLRLESDGASTVVIAYGSPETFDNLNIHVARGTTKKLRLIAEMATASTGASRNDVVRAEFITGAPLTFVSSTRGTTFHQVDLGTDNASFSSLISELPVRLSQLSVRTAPDSPTSSAPRDTQADVLHVALKADASGGVKVRTLAFRVRPSDVHTLGANNDLLERWVNQTSSATIKNVVTLRWSGDNYVAALGETNESSAAAAFTYANTTDNRTAPTTSYQTVDGDSGIITYTFPEGYEPNISAGQEVTFRLYLDTTWFSLGSKSLNVQMLGAHDLGWVDGLVGSSVATIDGTTVSGVPTAPSTLSIP